MCSQMNGISNDLQSSSFGFYDFPLEVGELKCICEIIKMQDSLFIWIGDANERKMNNLSVAFKSNYEPLPIATRIMGSMEDSTSSNLSKRLTKKYNIPVYASFNLNAANFTLLGIEKSLSIELKNRPHIFQSQSNDLA